jgi:hypothetical protein
MSEPEFIAQTGEPMTSDERRVWVRAQIEAARAQGATFFRLAQHQDAPDLLLVEGWSKQPDDQGEPRFQMVSLVGSPKQ